MRMGEIFQLPNQWWWWSWWPPSKLSSSSWFMVHSEVKETKTKYLKKRNTWNTWTTNYNCNLEFFFSFDWPYAQFQSSKPCYWWWWKLNFTKEKKIVNTIIIMISSRSDDHRKNKTHNMSSPFFSLVNNHILKLHP